MTENPYAIPVEDLVDSVRLPVAEQFVEQPHRRLDTDLSPGPVFFADDAVCDADGA